MPEEKIIKKLKKIEKLRNISDEQKKELLSSREGLLFYRKFYNDNLSFEQIGKLWKAIEDYSYNGEEPSFGDDINLTIAFSYIKKDLDYNNNEYILSCLRNKENGEKGGRPSKKYENVFEEIERQACTEKLDKICKKYEESMNTKINTAIKSKLAYCILLCKGDIDFVEHYIKNNISIDDMEADLEKKLNKTK